MLKNEELMIEAKNFFDYYKKEIGESLRKGNKVIFLDFTKLTEFSNTLSEKIISNPEETIEILKSAIEESGLVNNIGILVSNVPDNISVSLNNLRLNHLTNLIKFKGRIIRRGKIIPRIYSLKFECPSCGTIRSVLQAGKKLRQPSRCACGRIGNFKTLSKELRETVKAFIQDVESGDGMEITFSEDFLKEDLASSLNEGNIVSIIGIVEERPSKKSELELEYTIKPMGLELIEEEPDKTDNISRFIDILQTRGNSGAYEFEQIVGLLFRKKGYGVKVTRSSGDYGIDVVAEKAEEKIAIQCKLNDSEIKTSNSVIQRALGALTSPYNATKLIVISTSNEYTEQAKEQSKKAKVPVELWNRDKLIAEYNAHVNDLEEAWDILNKETGPFPVYLDKSFNIDNTTETLSSTIRLQIFVVRDIIIQLESRLGKMIPIEEIEKELEGNLTKEEIKEAITKLDLSGVIFKSKEGYVSRT